MRVKVTKDVLSYQNKPKPRWIVRYASGELAIAAMHITLEQAPNDITIKELGLIKDVLGSTYIVEVVV
jgi:hypothetical protein